MASAAKYAKPDFSNVLHEELKCFICDNGAMAGKHHWYKCMEGHMICQDCKEVKEMKKCSCNKSFVKGHCKMTEALLKVDKMRFKCKNLIRGCQETMNEEDMIFHQSECIYRLVESPRYLSRCPYDDFEYSFHKLIDDMKGRDEISEVEIEMSFQVKTSFDVVLYCFCIMKPVMIVIDGNVFFYVMHYRDKMFHSWIYLHGSPLQAKNYSYTLEYKNEENTVSSRHVGKVIPIDESNKAVIEKGNCMVVSDKLFKAEYIMESRPDRDYALFKPSIKIRNLKQEAKDENVESGISDSDE